MHPAVYLYAAVFLLMVITARDATDTASIRIAAAALSPVSGAVAVASVVVAVSVVVAASVAAVVVAASVVVIASVVVAASVVSTAAPTVE